MPLTLLAVSHRFSSAITLPSAVVIRSRSEREAQRLCFTNCFSKRFEKQALGSLQYSSRAENSVICSKFSMIIKIGGSLGAIAIH